MLDPEPVVLWDAWAAKQPSLIEHPLRVVNASIRESCGNGRVCRVANAKLYNTRGKEFKKYMQTLLMAAQVRYQPARERHKRGVAT